MDDVSLSDSPIVWESESFEEEKQKWFVKQHIMFLIDASKPMFNTYNNTTYFATSIELCKRVVLKLIRESRNDKIGILIYGTNDENKKCPKYINVLSEPIKPNIQLIKKLDDVLTGKLIQTGQCPLSPLSDAVWYGNYLTKRCSENQSCSTIMLMSCNDQPEIGDTKKQFHLRTRIDDVIKNNIDFKLIPIGATFNMNLFYGALLKNLSISKPINGLESIDDIMSEINDKLKHGRSVSKIKFFINNNFYISTSLYKFYTKSKMPSKVKLDKKTNKPLTCKTQVYTLDTKELMYKSDQAKYLVSAGEKIIFKNEDITILKSGIIEPGIRLLGFTNKENIMIWYHFKTSIFLRPNNDVVEGSTRMFNTLLECCLEKNKCIMCFLKIRKGGKVHLSALIPQAEIINETGTQNHPSGFHVIFLPFHECLKPVKPIEPTKDYESLKDEQISIGMKICENMPINYYPSLIKNPKINFHWAMLESMALESEVPEVLDETLPANDVFEKSLSTVKNNLHKLLLVCDDNLPQPPIKQPTKRPDVGSQRGKEKKKKMSSN
ncbi:X-ray repair cross-complementing protein 5-like [Myzus persicae]|uniref:X-ray repair cross-complementing protein 5-like n=1 Tax=Myzus persicae TaxID=13164 RepID=UPI000B92FA87|nr:X-ray repair cross-complementing protein 5-like [Myzus persicae]